jgi:hypothetical protein
MTLKNNTIQKTLISIVKKETLHINVQSLYVLYILVCTCFYLGAVVFQSVFHLEIYQNNIFFYF